MLGRIKNKVKNSVVQIGTRNLSIFKSKNVTVNQVQAIDQLENYLSKGDLNSATNLITTMKNFVDSQHPAAPYYKYEFGINDNGEKYIAHIPAFPGAEKIAPLKGKMSVIIPKQYKQFKSMKELVNFSYGTQQILEFDLQSLKTWFGEKIIDEYISQESQTAKVKIIPSKFPPPTPMKLYLKDNSWSIDYLLIGVSRIEQNIIILNNQTQQSSPFFIEMILDINRTKAKININLTKSGFQSVKNILKFIQLIETSNEENKPTIALKILETDNDIFSGPNWNFDTPDSPRPDNFKIFLEKLLYIEDHFNKEFTFPTNISQQERRIVDLVYHSLKDGELKVPFNQTYYFHLDKKQDIYRLLELHDENNEVLNIGLDLHSTDNLNLFGVEFKYVSNRVFLENVKLKKPNILQSKYELFEDGDSIRIELIPNEPHSYISEKLLLEVLA